MNIQSVYSFASPYFRRRRRERFASLFKPRADTTIIDIGGYPWDWKDGRVRSRFTIVNLDRPQLSEEELKEWNVTVADGRALPFADNSFDIAYSNSVIEHLSTYENQQEFAAEMRRVGRRLWVQTPARSFPIEPHLLTPFIHYLPRRLQRSFFASRCGPSSPSPMRSVAKNSSTKSDSSRTTRCSACSPTAGSSARSSCC